MATKQPQLIKVDVMGPTTICKSFDFDAAHHLPAMPEGHKCRRPHGHTYRVEIRMRGQVDEKTGLLVDYSELAKAWEPIHALLDHRDLNELFANPTTEVLAWFIAGRILHHPFPDNCGLHSVRLYESSTTYAEVLW